MKDKIKITLAIIIISILVSILGVIIIPDEIAMEIANFISGFPIFSNRGEMVDLVGTLTYLFVKLIEFIIMVVLLMWIFNKLKKKKTKK